MSATTPSTRETRPPSQPSRDRLVLQVENVVLAGRRLLAIEIFEVQNAATTPSSPLRSTPQPSTPSSTSLSSARASGFRVAARDEVENEYSLFVTLQKAEYLYRAAYPVEAAANEDTSSEAMANGILAHLSIIGNRQRGVGKLVCREPEPHVEKKSRVVPVSTPPHKQKNPHLPSKRQDQRAVRVQKTSKRAMEAVAQAMRRPDSDLSGDDESAGSEVESNKPERKNSEASLLHRMAVADSKTMWKAELETNYEESDHTSFVLDDDTESNFLKNQQYALPPGLSPVKRALPERKTKHKDLEVRRQKGRHQRILVTQAVQEAPSSALLDSIPAQNPYSVVIEETEQDASSDASRRSSGATVSSTEKPITQPRASSAPRSCVVVGNAYSLRNLYESETSEPEQFLRRRTLDAHRSVLPTDQWQDDIFGMGIEITDERPSLITPPNRLDALLSTARHVMTVNTVGSTLQRSTSNVKQVSEKEHSRISTSPTLSLYSAVRGASHSGSALQSPKLQKPSNDYPVNAGPEEQAPTTKLLTLDDNTTGGHAAGEQRKATAEPSTRNSLRPRSKSTSTEPGIVTPNGIAKAVLPEIVTPVLPSTAHPMAMDPSVLAQTNMRPRSNSVGSERIVRLSPLPTTMKPPVQDFLAAAEPVVTTPMASTHEDDITPEKEVSAPPSDPEIVLCPSSNLITDVNKAFSAEETETSKEWVSDLAAAAGPRSPQCFEEVLRANEKTSLPTVDGTIADTGIMKSNPNEVSKDVAEQDVDSPPTSRQACWEESTATISPEVLDEKTYDSTGGDVLLVMKGAVPEIVCGLEPSPLEQGPSEAIVTEANNSAEEQHAELHVVADNFIVDGGDYYNRNGDEEVSDDLVRETLVVQEGIGSINTVLQRQDTNENATPDGIDATNDPSIVDEVVHQTDPTGELEQSFEKDDKVGDANSGESMQSGASSTSEDTLHIHASPDIDGNAWRVAATVQELTGSSSEVAVDSTEQIQDRKIITDKSIYPGEATEKQDSNLKRVSRNHKNRAQMPVVNETGHSEVVNATICFGKDTFDEDIGNDESISKRELDADKFSCDVLVPDDTSSQPMQPHQTPSLDTERKNEDVMVLVEEDEKGEEPSSRRKESVQTVVEEADSISFHKTIVGLPQTPTYDEENYTEQQNAGQNILSSRTDTVAATSGQTYIRVSSSEHEKASTISRKKSLSPGKKTGSASNTTHANPAPKVLGSRRRSTVVQVLDAQAEAPQTLQFERRRTAEDVKRRGKDSRRISTLDQSKPLPGLASSATATTAKPTDKVLVEKSPGEVLRSHSKRQLPTKRQPSHSSGSSQNVSNYHKKWGKWMVGRSIIEKVGCLQLEDLVIADPRNEENLLKLGLRYTKWPGTSLPGILILEHAVLLQKTLSRTQDYWFWLGSAHLDIFMRHRKYLPVARFHLSKSIWAFTSAFAYMESLADPMRLLRYAIGLFWHKGDGNLEKTRDICHELFSRFVSFCDKDLPNVLFLQFQVFHRLKFYVDAIECMNKIVGLHERLSQQVVSSLSSTNAIAHFSVYDAADYRLMLMQCQQASGDYVSAALSLAAVLKLKGVQQDTTLRDEEYFDLWCSLAEKSFHHEDYALALEYYAIALNFAKQSQVLAAIHYNLGLCFQSLGEDNKCVTEYKRARTANRHVAPLVSLAEISIPYDERFALLLQKSVAQVIEEVRVELYGRAVKRLQRVFRSRRNVNIGVDSASSDSPLTKMPSLSKRRLSIAAARNPPALVKLEDTADKTGVHEEASSQQNPAAVGDNQVARLEDSTLDFVERRHEFFLARKQIAMEEMVELLMNTQYRGRETSPTFQPKAQLKPGMQLRSGMLSPEKDRLDVRRKQSMEAFRQLGYVSSTMPWIEFWEKLLTLVPQLYESRQALYGSIARIRGRLPLVTDEVAFCALAESIGNVHEAAEKLHDALYERELTYVCAVVEVSKQLERDFPLESTQLPVKAPHVSLPTISSPRADHSSAHSPVEEASRRIVFPPYSPIRAKTESISKPKKHLRMNQMLNLHFQEHVQQQEAAIAITEATGGFVQRHRRMEKLMVLQDFRQANDVLLRSQLAFGSEKAVT
ncbi:hypothetical protein KRP22_002423 [Phytophthora ramorum]|nr:hypothetical protein KRP22_6071 [Phytophthora ramorum]